MTPAPVRPALAAAASVNGDPFAAYPEQARIVLTPHPLQRIGAFGLCALAAVATTGELADAGRPEEVTPEAFSEATELMIGNACDAAEAGRVGRESFWLKASGAFFPNSAMNHRPTLGKRPRAENERRIREWRTIPDPSVWPDVPCALCGRAAVAFYGKVDVPLIEAAGYCNTIPRGHGGFALCWPCVCCFHALPYATRLTGGPSTAVHSWDEKFLRRTVLRQLDTTRRQIAVRGTGNPSGRYEHERTALLSIRGYGDRISAGVELIVFSNDNRGASLGRYTLEEPLAEWMRATIRDPELRRGWRSLLAAYARPQVAGNRRLAYDAFRNPLGIFATAARRLTGQGGLHAVRRFDKPLAVLFHSFIREVMDVNQADIDLVGGLARAIAQEIAVEQRAGALVEFRVASRSPTALQKWIEKLAVRRVLGRSKVKAVGPLITTGQFRLLFDPDGQSWLYRRILTVGVLEALHELGWRPEDAEEELRKLQDEDDADNGLAADDLTAEDEEYLEGTTR